MRRALPLSIFAVLIAVVAFAGCRSSEPAAASASEKGFYVQEFNILVPELHGFAEGRPSRQDAREMFLLTRGEGFIWLGDFVGLLVKTDTPKAISEIWQFAQDRIYTSSYLTGTHIRPLVLEKADNPTRPYVRQVLYVERTKDLYDIMSRLDRELQEAEIKRFPVDKPRILVNYYTPIGDDVYVFSFEAPPSDFLFWEDDARKVFLKRGPFKKDRAGCAKGRRACPYL
jgi:hypothetical protein